MMPLLSLLSLIGFSSAYLYGDYSNIHCWKTNWVTKEQVLLDLCPQHVNTTWIKEPPLNMVDMEHDEIIYKIFVPASMQIVTNPQISHTNLHACKKDTGTCTPNVANTKSLTTATAAQSGDLSQTIENSAHTLEVTHDLPLSYGGWTIIAHSRWHALENGVEYRYDIAIGVKRDVAKITYEHKVSEGAHIAVYVFTGLVLIIELAVLAFGEKNQELSPIKAASWPFCQGIIVFAMLGCVSVFFLPNPTDFSCVMYPILIILSFDGMIGLLVIKTHRVKNIFTRKSLKGGSSDNSNAGIIKLWALVIVLPDVLLLLAWTIASPLKPTINFDSANNWEWVCDSELNSVFYTIALILKGALMAYGLYLATATWNINPKFNESRLIAITMYSVTILSAFGLPTSGVLEGQPSELFVFRSAIILAVSLSTIITIFAPKYHLILTVDPSEFQKVGENGNTYKSRRSASGFQAVGSRASTVSTVASGDTATLKNGKLSDNVMEAMELAQEGVDAILKRQNGGMVVHAKDVLKSKVYVDTLKALMDSLARTMKQNPDKIRSAMSNSVVEMLKKDEEKEEALAAKTEKQSKNPRDEANWGTTLSMDGNENYGKSPLKTEGMVEIEMV